MDTIVWAVVGLVLGGAIGAGLVWILAVRRAGPMSVSEMKKENERFREEVNAHFVETAQLINELTDSYKKVFDHLSEGAERLVDKDAVRERMPQVGQQEVRLRHIGAPSERDGSAQGGSKPGGTSPETGDSGGDSRRDSRGDASSPAASTSAGTAAASGASARADASAKPEQTSRPGTGSKPETGESERASAGDDDSAANEDDKRTGGGSGSA